MRIDSFAFAYLEYSRAQKTTTKKKKKKKKKTELYQTVHSRGRFCRHRHRLGPRLQLRRSGIDSQRLRVQYSGRPVGEFFFSICDGCHSGNVASHHCDC